MTRHEADALITYIGFMVGPSADIMNPSLFNPAAMSDVLRNFNKSERKPSINGNSIIDQATHAGDALNYLMMADFAKRGELTAEELADFKSGVDGQPFTVERKPYTARAVRMPVYSFNEFKELTQRKDRVQVYAVSKLRETILDFARNIGYALTAEIPKAGASVLELTFEGEDIETSDEPIAVAPKRCPFEIEDDYANRPGNFTSVEKLWERFSDAGFPGANDNRTTILQFAKLVRRLTIEETTEGITAEMYWENDGTTIHTRRQINHVPDEDIIKLPKDFKL